MKSKILSQRIVLHIIHIVVRFMNAHAGTTGGTSERELKSPTVSSVSGSAEAGSDEAGSDEVWIRVRWEETTRHLPGAVKRKKIQEYNENRRRNTQSNKYTNKPSNRMGISVTRCCCCCWFWFCRSFGCFSCSFFKPFWSLWSFLYSV